MTIPTDPILNEEWTNNVTGVTYKWDGTRWYVVSTSDAELEENYVTKVAFQADQERQDTAFEEDQQRQDDSIESIEDGQVIQDGQINALETQIQLLAQTQAVGKWTYQRNITSSVRPPVSRTFTVLIRMVRQLKY